MLIATLPSADNRDLTERILSHPSVEGTRYNVGIRSSLDPAESLGVVSEYARRYGKRLWIDLKGRQLRITKWADPTYGDIELNHEIDVELPARIFFRGNEWSNVVAAKENRIYVQPDPPHALGAGQAVNIHAKRWDIRGTYLTQQDREYLAAGKGLGLHDYMLSFVERPQDLEEVLALDPHAKLRLKIESKKGLAYAASAFVPGVARGLVAARDDLFINIGDDKTAMLGALRMIVERDPDAILTSHLFTGLARGGLSMADISDLHLMHSMGYRSFMLSDGISHHHFDDAMRCWEDHQKYVHR